MDASVLATLNLSSALQRRWSGSHPAWRIQHFPSAAAFLEAVPGTPARAVLFGEGLEADAVERVRDLHPGIPVMFVHPCRPDRRVLAWLAAGAEAWLSGKESRAELFELLDGLTAGHATLPAPMLRRLAAHYLEDIAPADSYALSPREREVLLHLVAGESYRAVAEHCGISLDTVRTHVRRIYEKLHVHSKSEAVALALREHLI